MAAGMGSRFGKGIKQLEHVGPSGEILMDYSIYDAIKAGFDKVVIVIRRDIEDEFRKLIGDRISKYVKLDYVYQELENIPEGFSLPEGRVKPWGTGHAVLACEGHIHTPFAVINADDYYGREAFEKIHDYLASVVPKNKDKYCMAGYVLGNTLSDKGTVTRGICHHDSEYNLTKVDETFQLKEVNGVVIGKNSNGDEVNAPLDSLVSMNMWGCEAEYLKILKSRFVEFLADNSGDPLKKEFLLPNIMDKMITEGNTEIKILPVSERWFGLTYIEDKPFVVEELQKMIDAGKYPTKLWE